MTDEERIRQLLASMVGTSDTPEDVCSEQPELLIEVRRRWEQMRRAVDQIDRLFPIPTSDSAKLHTSPRSHDGEMPQIAGYEMLSVLGRGGMGIVYKARHLKLNRIVAVKMMLSGRYATPQELSRFARESRAVAELQHPHIVQVHDVGEIEGRPFFTMEFVDGATLAQELAGVPQSPRRAAELVTKLAEAMDLAHSKGIIHRDLKPANILLTGDGTPKVADFGLARHLDGDPGLTFSDARIGTPSYMAPEQALGRLGLIGSSVDIYSLGAILYEMLTGRPPFRAETAIETERQVITVEAAPPRQLNADVPRDLETVCLKCLQKDSSRRYPNAAELAEDLSRYLDGRPVNARPTGVMERIWSWGKRNRSMALALSGLALLLAFIVVGSIWSAAYFHMLEGEQRKLAKEKTELAEEKSQLAVEKEQERAKAVLAENREAGLRRQSEAQGKELRRNLYLTEMNLAGQAAAVPGGLGRVGELLAHWEQASPDLRNWEWFYLNSLCHRSLSTRMSHGKSVHSLAWSHNGAKLAFAGNDRTIYISDEADERALLRLTGHMRDVFSVAWSPDAQRLASASWDHTVRVWDTTDGTELFQFQGHTAEVYVVAWSPDGKTIASGGLDRTILAWDAATGTILGTFRSHSDTVSGLTWSPDSRYLASASHDTTVRVWDVAAGKERHTLVGHRNWVNQVAWSPDGSRVASASNDETLRIWSPENGEELRVLSGHSQGVISVAWNRDGSRLASASDDQTVKVWLAATGTMTFSLRGHAAPLTCVAWNPKNDRLASAGHERAIKIWDASTGPESPALTDHRDPVQALAWCPQDSKLFASADSTGIIQVWDLPRRTAKRTLRGDEHHVYSIAWHPAGTRLASASGDGLIRIWNLTSETAPDLLKGHEGVVHTVAWSPDGRRIASGGLDRTMRIWDLAAGRTSRVIKNHDSTVFNVAWSGDSRKLASASADGTVKIWDVSTDEECLCYRGHTSQVITVAWSPDDTVLASAGFDQTIHLWDATTGQRSASLRGHTTHVAQVSWSPDGTRLASAGRDGTVKVWDTESGKETLTPHSHVSQVNAAVWSPDGMILASAGIDRQIRIHDASTGYVAARSMKLLPAINHRLAADPSLAAERRIRAEIYARNDDWKQAGIDISNYLLRNVHATWFMMECFIAGPFPEGLNGHYPPEEVDLFNVKLSSVHGAKASEQVIWRIVPQSDQGIVDFSPLTENKNYVSAYALFPIYSLDDQQVAILLGSDDQARLWLNGEQLYESSRSRVAVPDEDAILVMLKSGWNTLLVRVANETRDHILFVRLSDSATDLARVRKSK